jgi:hypothetical protein
MLMITQVIHMWYTGTLLTGIHYGTGRRTADISVMDSVHAMRVSCPLFTTPIIMLTILKVLVALLSCLCVRNYIS